MDLLTQELNSERGKHKMADNRFVFLDSNLEDAEKVRPSLTYWQDAWRRLKKNKLSMIGVVTIIFVLLFALLGPYFTPFSYSDQDNQYKNLPPVLDVFNVDEDANFYLSSDYNMFRLSDNGRLEERLENTNKDPINKVYTYVMNVDGEEREVILDFSYNLLPTKQGYDYDYTITYEGVEYTQPTDSMWNKTYPFGTDDLPLLLELQELQEVLHLDMLDML